ncbi:hypothetical protein SAMN05192564_1011404 [Paraburkholderia sartisoli]|uniref:Uncharacterized protein n=1 Tax=Paraburkholderia sartisoli TaxID=83784 RepID=A0A1H4B0S3_9BURK|nr:hypothetical protein SAMN05192564_1011404 [Paraburkholderia sartisoli]
MLSCEERQRSLADHEALYLRTLMVRIEQTLLGGNVPWTPHHPHSDHEMLEPASQCKPITYPEPGGICMRSSFSVV